MYRCAACGNSIRDEIAIMNFQCMEPDCNSKIFLKERPPTQKRIPAE